MRVQPCCGLATAVACLTVFALAAEAAPITLLSPTPVAEDRFGAAVAVSGNRVAVGAPAIQNTATAPGSVHVFDATTGSHLLAIANPNPMAGDNFGFSAAYLGTNLLVGAPFSEEIGRKSGVSATSDK